MSKKDYIKLAEVFRIHLQPDISMEQLSMINSIMVDVMNVLKEDNPKFDKVRFANAVHTEKK